MRIRQHLENYTLQILDTCKLRFDFIESLRLLDIQLNHICNAVSRSSTQSGVKEQTEEILKCFSLVFASNPGCCTQAKATLALKTSTKPVF